MSRTMARFVSAPRREEGATAIEYALMIVMVALVVLFAAAALGGETVNFFADMATKL